MSGKSEHCRRKVTLLERLSRRWQQASKVSCFGGAYIRPPHAGTAPSWRFGGYLFLRVFAFQYGVPGGAIGRHFELKVVGRGRKHLNGESSFYGLWAHPCLALPSPSISVHIAFGVVGFAQGVESVVGVHLVVAVVAHVGRFRTFPHGAIELGVGHQEECTVHPLDVACSCEFAAGAHRSRLYVAFRGPCASEVVEFL